MRARAELKKMRQKDKRTQAYNALVFEDLIEKEMAPSQRYQHPFALLAFELDNPAVLKRKILPTLRKSDYFGRLEGEGNRYAILATHSGLMPH